MWNFCDGLIPVFYYQGCVTADNNKINSHICNINLNTNIYVGHFKVVAVVC